MHRSRSIPLLSDVGDAVRRGHGRICGSKGSLSLSGSPQCLRHDHKVIKTTSTTKTDDGTTSKGKEKESVGK